MRPDAETGRQVKIQIIFTASVFQNENSASKNSKNFECKLVFSNFGNL